MWKAVFRNSAGGDLDEVVAASEDGLRVALAEKLHEHIGWTLEKGDSIVITDDNDED